MKAQILGLAIVVLLLGATVTIVEAKGNEKNGLCTAITEGSLTYGEEHYLAGQPLQPGFDIYGYNYNAHLFIGYFCNVYLGGYGFPPYEGDDEAYYQRLVEEGYANSIEEARELMESVWCWEYRKDWLVMKWNDAWLSNKDCDGDGKLDTHYGYDSYIGSGAWETNHMWGTYELDGTICRWEYFVKIVAVPEDAYLENGTWYTADGTEIGPAIWGQFAVIQEVYNDPCGGYHGIMYLSPAPAGLGFYGK
ncbi:hypothetical protein [Archaeoglobus profundus]|uniref:Uncharacterized protein n=1 Tax=Archaeoglobus profundus (strain DSM 5631 / JCM 9629 / NBRC 100127 / Av18) TaxID=572546 RepID=D2RI77_ARCPA|nr:hypothetical protein [Archaeoglobus profundus]ADB58002.1 hypothetical protein Arcpr_0941 [Archaeoglobus profundus DSM 5631]